MDEMDQSLTKKTQVSRRLDLLWTGEVKGLTIRKEVITYSK